MSTNDRDDRENPKLTLSRRRLLGGTCAAIGSASVGAFGFQHLAHADVPLPSGRAFIFVYFAGGWDQLLFLDPRDPERFPDAERGRTLIEPGYSQLDTLPGYSSRVQRPAGGGPLSFGPATSRTADAVKLTDFADRIAIIRGINMSTLGHEVGYRYLLTGKFPVGLSARGTSVATEIVGQMVPRRPIPNLSLRVESYNDRHAGRASALRVDSIDDLLLVLAPSAYQERDVVEQALADYGQRVGPCDVEAYDRRGLFSSMRESRAQADGIVRQRLSSHFEFVSADTEAATAIRTKYGFARGAATAPGARLALAAQAIKLGISQVVSVQVGGGLDTHFAGNDAHAQALYPSVAAVTALLDDLRGARHPEGGTFLDHTTVMCFSEFSRTALFNNFGGRDHHLTGSCLLAGGGIRGNTVVGASSDLGMGPRRYDFNRQMLSDEGENIKPEHVAATLLASAGLDPYVTRVEPLRAILARP